MAKVSTVAMKIGRRPYLSAAAPQTKPPVMAPRPEETRMIADSRKLSPHGVDDERQHEANQKVVEELEHISDDCRRHDATLITCQSLLSVELTQHLMPLHFN